MMRLIAILLLSFCTSCQGSSQTFTLFNKEGVVPVVIVTDEHAAGVAAEFCSLFEKVTGYRPALKGAENAKNGPAIAITLLTDAVSDYSFRLFRKNNTVTIEGTDKQSLRAAVHYFYRSYAGFIDLNTGETPGQLAEIKVPSNLNYTHTPGFEYREPYFPDNFNPDFRSRNMTQTLEETWALWGHNIRKAIPVTDAMYAATGSTTDKSQFCFSSPELENALSVYVRQQAKENPARNKFMVMPDDNDVVCLCSRCKAAGNTKGNASPAVFSLLNRLAKQYPQQQFYSTAYSTTQTPPPFALEPNAGVMVSTMAFPKGVVIENSPKKNAVDAAFAGWKAVTGRIYLWDYAVNFDNYFDFYPTVSIAQKNLQYYKAKGVTGVFMHGSEENNSAFAGLKCYLYSQLLQDTNADVLQLASLYLNAKYPYTAKELQPYYTDIETAALRSPRTLDIYGGIKQSLKKYLESKPLTDVYNSLMAKIPSLPAEQAKELQPLLAAMAFQQLEIMRTNAFEDNGYGVYNEENATARVRPSVQELLKNLKSHTDAAGITVYNESGFRVADYIDAWQTEILNTGYKNLLYGKKFSNVRGADEDYPATMLTDGNIGFTDYYNNWLMATGGNLILELNAKDVKGAKTVEMAFLSDERHKIYLPEKVIIKVGERVYEAKTEPRAGSTLYKYKVTVPVKILAGNENITIEIVKRHAYKNKSIACDEVYFK